jgi:GNAT superfamily N-acetyltransferase
MGKLTNSNNPHISQYLNRNNNNRLFEYLESINLSFEDFKDSIEIKFKNINTEVTAKSKYVAYDLGGISFQIIENDDYIKSAIFGGEDIYNKICFKPNICAIIIVETKDIFQRIGLANRMFNLLINQYEKYCHFCLEIEAFAFTTFDVIDAFYKKLGFENYHLYVSEDYRWRI